VHFTSTAFYVGKFFAKKLQFFEGKFQKCSGYSGKVAVMWQWVK